MEFTHTILGSFIALISSLYNGSSMSSNTVMKPLSGASSVAVHWSLTQSLFMARKFLSQRATDEWLCRSCQERQSVILMALTLC